MIKDFENSKNISDVFFYSKLENWELFKNQSIVYYCFLEFLEDFFNCLLAMFFISN